jgi:hypothetical protein
VRLPDVAGLQLARPLHVRAACARSCRWASPSITVTGYTCTASSAGGTFAADVEAAPVTAGERAAAVVGSYVEIEARGVETFALLVPATPGDYSCADATKLDYDAGNAAVAASASTCAVTPASIGDVGQPVTGTFSATVGATSIANGTFSVGRVPYP